MEPQNPLEMLHQMITAVEHKAAEMGVPAVVLLGLFTHAANTQSINLHAMMSRKVPTVAEQIMANRRTNVQ